MASLCQSHEAASPPRLAEAHGAPIPRPGLKLWDLFCESVDEFPSNEALVSRWQKPRDAEGGDQDAVLRWTFPQLKQEAERLAEALSSRGCRPGMRLAAVLWNSAEWALLFWATAKLGMAFVPIDPSTARDASRMVCQIQPHVVVAHDLTTAHGLELDSTALLQPRLCIVCSKEAAPGWVELGQLSVQTPPAPALENRQEDGLESDDEKNDDEDDIALIVFTSGTTGEPKGCLHTHQNLVAQSENYDPEPDPSIAMRWLAHTPVSHIFAINNALRAWRSGSPLIFPSKSFNVDATLRALVRERCTFMAATPTLIKALVAHPEFTGAREFCLRYVSLGGTNIGAADVRLCREALGAKAAIQAYGMSEGAPVLSWARTDPSLVDGYRDGVGKALPGAAVRVCRPGSRHVVRRSEVGELHIGGMSVIRRYFGQTTSDDIYRDESGSWLATGDQARMDDDGVVHLLGRYKDIIIRGGENIYPAKIEAVLGELAGVKAQVVGVPDDVAGQVPVAVAILPEDTKVASLVERSRALGPRYTLDGVYTLEQLGLDKFPVTSLGKVKRGELKQRVIALRQSEQAEDAESSSIAQPTQTIEQTLLDAWERLTGTRPARDEAVTYWADSITLLRYCDRVLRACGQRLYLQDFLEHETVEKQAALLLSREKQRAALDAHSQSIYALTQDLLKARPAFAVSDTGSPRPPVATVCENTVNGSPLACSKKVLDSAQETVVRHGLSTADIQDTLPVRSSLHRTVLGPRPQSYHTRMVLKAKGVSRSKIRRGLERALKARPLFRSMVFQTDDGSPQHAVLAPETTGLMDHIIHDIDVPLESEALERCKDGSPEGHSCPFMFQVNIFTISPDSHVLCFTFSHSIIDALTLTQWFNELDRWIEDEDAAAALPPPTPFRLFSDLFTQYEQSQLAQANVAFHVGKLRGISRLGEALWPPQRAPGWMIASDAGSPHAEQRRGVRQTVWNNTWEDRKAAFQYPRSARVVLLPGLPNLRYKHGIEPSLFAKTAIFLFNVLWTGASHALLTVWESGRSWPFVPSWMNRLLPPAMSIDGPTTQWLLNATQVLTSDAETVGELFQRMRSEQEQMKLHEHAPWNRVLEGLGDEGDAALEASFRQGFVWDLSMAMAFSQSSQSDLKVLEPTARYDWPDCGLFWNAFMMDKEHLYFIASWDTAQMNDEEVDECCESLADVMRKLSDEENWDKQVCDVFPRPSH